MKQSSSSNKYETALITGASSGIGSELARLFAHDGYHLVLVARRKDKLTELAAQLKQNHGVQVMVLVKDLAEPDAAAAIYQKLCDQNITIDILVNNAGFGSYGFFAKSELAHELNLVQVNVVALMHLTRLFLPDMIRRGNGKILNVASTAAFAPGPLMANYYASKAYVLSLTEALANELNGTGVSATVLCPGATTSEFHQNLNMEQTTLRRLPFMTAAAVARIGYCGLMAGKTIVIPGWHHKAMAWLVRFTPRKWVTAIVRSLQETRKRKDQE